MVVSTHNFLLTTVVHPTVESLLVSTSPAPGIIVAVTWKVPPAVTLNDRVTTIELPSTIPKKPQDAAGSGD